MKQEKNTAIVLAAGQGKRMNSRIQKQFLEIDHRPVLYYSLECFQKSPLIQDIILVTGEFYKSDKGDRRRKGTIRFRLSGTSCLRGL